MFATYNQSQPFYSVMNLCKRCGACCKNGGPALHTEDLPLFKNRLQIENCITIREAEPVFNPLSQTVEPAQSELIKIAGIANSWQCCFFNEDQNKCGIYNNRPVECVLLKCWDTDALTQIIFTETLTRVDILTDEQLLKLIKKHDRHCSYRNFEELAKKANYFELNQMISQDIAIRQEAVSYHRLSLAKELFYFGRPLFKSAEFYNVVLRETRQGIQVFAP